MRNFWKLFGVQLLLLLATVISVTVLSPEQIMAKDLELTKVVLSKTVVTPGETIELTYWLRSQGQLHSAFNMGIFIAKGGNGKWVRRWGLPIKLLDNLKSGKIISQKWSIMVPEWGDGIYRLSIHADVENRLFEPDRKNNTIEKKLTAGKVAIIGNIVPMAPVKPLIVGRKTRTIKPDGSVEIRFADGSGKILRPNGKIALIQKDGSIITTKSLQVPSSDLPPLPGQADDWVEDVQEKLLHIIEDQLDDSEIDQYMNSESEKNNYDLVLWRISFIDFILSE